MTLTFQPIAFAASLKPSTTPRSPALADSCGTKTTVAPAFCAVGPDLGPSQVVDGAAALVSASWAVLIAVSLLAADVVLQVGAFVPAVDDAVLVAVCVHPASARPAERTTTRVESGLCELMRSLPIGWW